MANTGLFTLSLFSYSIYCSIRHGWRKREGGERGEIGWPGACGERGGRRMGRKGERSQGERRARENKGVRDLEGGKQPLL